MDNSQEPANSNLSLSHFTKNPQKDLANLHIKQVIELLGSANIPSSMIADALFERLNDVMIPMGKMTGQSATIWYAQLQRMRDEMNRRIAMIEEELDRQGDHH